MRKILEDYLIELKKARLGLEIAFKAYDNLYGFEEAARDVRTELGVVNELISRHTRDLARTL